jgi:hypothetical protein
VRSGPESRGPPSPAARRESAHRREGANECGHATAARYGARSVLGGVRIIATEIDPAGRIRQLADVQSLTYGEQDGSRTPRLRQLDETLNGAGFDAVLSRHIMQDMWQKWLQLATLGAVTCRLRGPGSFGTARVLGHRQRKRLSAIRYLR